MKSKRFTPEMLAKLSSEEQHEAMLLLEVLSRPRLARIYQPSSPQPFDPDDLRAALEAGIKHPQAPAPEEEQALLAWYDARGGKDDDLHPLVRATIRLARSSRGDFDGASEAQIEAEKARAAATAATKPADQTGSIEEPVSNALDEPPRLPVIIQRERQPRDIFEALNRPQRDSMQIGESYGSWRR
jgi:hypothetical protein